MNIFSSSSFIPRIGFVNSRPKRFRKAGLAFPLFLLLNFAGAIVQVAQSSSDDSCAALSPWNTGTVYYKGDEVRFNGTAYRAGWWTRGDRPDQNSGQWQVWTSLGVCSSDNNGGDNGGGNPGTPAGINGQLHVCGTKLCNQYGHPIQLRGMSSHGLQWYGWGDCVTESSLDALAYDWGADIFRISLYVQEGGYETDPAGFTAQVNRIIEEVTERGLYALVDWHQLSPGDPNANLDNAKNFFRAIAQRHKDKTNIIYDIANEPNEVSWDGIKQYAEQMIPFIRQYDSDAVILVGTHGWASLGISDGGSAQDIVNNPINATNFMYTFHFYAASHRAEYRNELAWAADRLPIFVTEWGSQTYTGDGANDFDSTQAYIDLMAQKKISWTSWNFSDDHRSGAAFKPGTCSSGGPWNGSNLKEAGGWVLDKIRYPADNFPTH